MRVRSARIAHGSPGFALLSETLIVGVVVGLATIPLVTALPALVAGVRHLRRHLDGENDTVVGLGQDLLTVFRRLWALGVAVPALVLLVAFDLWFATASTLPGGRVVAGLTAVLAAAGVVVLLRFAGTWSEEVTSGAQLRAAAVRACRDVSGSVLLAAAVVAAVVLVWMLPPMVMLVGGLLALASLAVEARRVARTAEPEAGP